MKNIIALALLSLTSQAWGVRMLQDSENAEIRMDDGMNYQSDETWHPPVLEKYEQPQVLPSEPTAEVSPLQPNAGVTPVAPITVVAPMTPAPVAEVLPVAPAPAPAKELLQPATIPPQINPGPGDVALNNSASTSYGYFNQRYDMNLTQGAPDIAAIKAKYPGVEVEPTWMVKRVFEMGGYMYDVKSQCQYGDTCTAAAKIVQQDYAKSIYNPSSGDDYAVCNTQPTPEAAKSCIKMVDEMVRSVVTKLESESELKAKKEQSNKTTYYNGYSEDNFLYWFTDDLGRLQSQQAQLAQESICVGGEAVALNGFLNDVIPAKIEQHKAKLDSKGVAYTNQAPAPVDGVNCAGQSYQAVDSENAAFNWERSIHTRKPIVSEITNDDQARMLQASVTAAPKDMAQLANLDAKVSTIQKYNCDRPEKPAECAHYDTYQKVAIPKMLETLCRGAGCQKRYAAYKQAAVKLAESKISPEVAQALKTSKSSAVINPVQASTMLGLARHVQTVLSMTPITVKSGESPAVALENLKQAQIANVQGALCARARTTAAGDCGSLAKAMVTKALDLKKPSRDFVAGAGLDKQELAAKKAKPASDVGARGAGEITTRATGVASIPKKGMHPESWNTQSAATSSDGGMAAVATLSPASVAAPTTTVASAKGFEPNSVTIAAPVRAAWAPDRSESAPVVARENVELAQPAPSKEPSAEAEAERVFSGYEKTKEEFEPNEEDNLFEKVSKAYVRNLDKVLNRRKPLEE